MRKKEFSFSNVIYSRSANRPRFRFRWETDSGEVIVKPGQLQFQGEKCQFEINSIVDIGSVPFCSWLFTLACIALFESIEMLVIFAICGELRAKPLLIGYGITLLVFLRRCKWTHITYANGMSQTEEAFFAEGPWNQKAILNAIKEQFWMESVVLNR